MFMTKLKAVALALAAGALFVAVAIAPAGAQINPLGPGDFAVPREDLTLLDAAEAKLHDPAAKVGTIESWQNAKNGDSGSVTLISSFERDGMPCRRVTHAIKVRGIKVERQFTISRCRVADGSWKIVP
jgi:surface antigen